MNEFLKKNLITLIVMVCGIATSYAVTQNKLTTLEKWVGSFQTQLSVVKSDVNDLSSIKTDIRYILEDIKEIKENIKD